MNLFKNKLKKQKLKRKENFFFFFFVKNQITNRIKKMTNYKKMSDKSYKILTEKLEKILQTSIKDIDIESTN